MRNRMLKTWVQKNCICWTLEPQKPSWLGNIQKKQITELSRVENLLIYTKAPWNYTF